MLPGPSLADEIGHDEASRGGTVMVVDSNGQSLERLSSFLRQSGFPTVGVSHPERISAVDSEAVAAAVVNLTSADSGDLLSALQAWGPELAIVTIVGGDDDQRDMESDWRGVFDRLQRPVQPDALIQSLRRAREITRTHRQAGDLRRAFCWPPSEVAILGNSHLAATAKHQMETFAPLDSTVLIVGPPGSGKTAAARWIHASGRRSARPLVPVQCDRIPSDLVELELFGAAASGSAGRSARAGGSRRMGRLEMADGGTLLLEEAAALPLHVQSQLVEVLQTRHLRRLGATRRQPVNVRMVVTLSEEPEELTRRGRLLEALHFRINVLAMRLPALARRREDIPELFDYMLARTAEEIHARPATVADDARDLLLKYDWPGNLHELLEVARQTTRWHTGETVGRTAVARVIERAKCCGKPPGDRAFAFAGQTMAEIERAAIVDTLRACRGNKAKAARQLGLSEKTIYNKIRQYNLRGQV